jgi:hypothetical protein
MRADTAAAMLDMSITTFRAVWPHLAARHGLKVAGFCGPKFSRKNILDVIERLLDDGIDVSYHPDRNVVCIGGKEFPIGSTRTGKSGRGRPRKHT